MYLFYAPALLLLQSLVQFLPVTFLKCPLVLLNYIRLDLILLFQHDGAAAPASRHCYLCFYYFLLGWLLLFLIFQYVCLILPFSRPIFLQADLHDRLVFRQQPSFRLHLRWLKVLSMKAVLLWLFAQNIFTAHLKSLFFDQYAEMHGQLQNL